MQPELDIVMDIGDEEYLDEVHGYYKSDSPFNEVPAIMDYGTEHEEADTVITKYVNDGDKASACP